LCSQVTCECQNPFCDARKRLANAKIFLVMLASGLRERKKDFWRWACGLQRPKVIPISLQAACKCQISVWRSRKRLARLRTKSDSLASGLRALWRWASHFSDAFCHPMMEIEDFHLSFHLKKGLRRKYKNIFLFTKIFNQKFFKGFIRHHKKL